MNALAHAPATSHTDEAELQIEFTTLACAFRERGWQPGKLGLTAEEIRILTGVNAVSAAARGWLCLRFSPGGRYSPAGPLLTELATSGETAGSPITTSDETPSAGTGELSSSQITGAAPALAAPVPKVGRWDAAPVQTRVAKDLADMINVLKEVSEETRESLGRMIVDQAASGFPEGTALENGAAHLLRLASDLHSALMDAQVSLSMARRRK